MKQVFLFFLLTTTFACAQNAISKKATSPCQPCMQLAAAADMIQKNLAGIEPDPLNTKTISKQDQAVNDMKTILEGFLKRKDALETQEEVDALLGAWGGIARYDNTGAIPNYSPIFDKLDPKGFKKIQSRIKEILTKETNPARKAQLEAIDESINVAYAQRTDGNQDP